MEGDWVWRRWFWSPKMGPYIFGHRNKIHIINLEQTLPLIKAFAKADDTEKAFWKRVIEKGDQREGDLDFHYRIIQGSHNQTLIRMLIGELYHLVRMGESLPVAIGRMAGRIGHVQFADAPGRGAPGTGDIDFAEAMQALALAGYRGWLAAEYRPDPADALRWLDNWRSAGWVAANAA